MKPVITLSALLLLASGLVKAFGASLEHAFLGQHALEWTALTYRQILLGTAFVEVVVATYLVTSRPSATQSRVLMALVASFWAYRLAALGAGIEGPCPCLGNMWHWTSLSAVTVNRLGSCLLVVLTTCAALSFHWKGVGRAGFSCLGHSPTKPQSQGVGE
jgi:hypothetical protein